MASLAQTMGGTAVGLMGVGLVGENLRYLNKKKKKKGDMIRLGVTNLVGVGLIGAAAGAAAGIP